VKDSHTSVNDATFRTVNGSVADEEAEAGDRKAAEDDILKRRFELNQKRA